MNANHKAMMQGNDDIQRHEFDQNLFNVMKF